MEKEKRKLDREMRRKLKESEKKNRRTYKPRRTREQVQIDIMKKEIQRRKKFDIQFKTKFGLSVRDISAIKRNAVKSN